MSHHRQSLHYKQEAKLYVSEKSSQTHAIRHQSLERVLELLRESVALENVDDSHVYDEPFALGGPSSNASRRAGIEYRQDILYKITIYPIEIEFTREIKALQGL